MADVRVWVDHSPHYSWCDVSDVSGISSFKRSERSENHQHLFITERRRGGGAKLILLLLLLLSEPTVSASLAHTYTHKPISSILFFFLSVSPLPSSHSPISLSFSFALANTRTHKCAFHLSFSRTHSIRRDPSTNIFLYEAHANKSPHVQCSLPFKGAQTLPDARARARAPRSLITGALSGRGGVSVVVRRTLSEIRRNVPRIPRSSTSLFICASEIIKRQDAARRLRGTTHTHTHKNE